MDINKIAKAIEDDAGQELPGLLESLAEMKAGKGARVHSPQQIQVRRVRTKVGLSQKEFAKRLQTPITTLRDWEQGRHNPPGAVDSLMGLIDKHPELINELESHHA